MRSLAEEAVTVVRLADLDAKADHAYALAKAWFAGKVGIGAIRASDLPTVPGRPPEPELIAPSRMPRRSKGGVKGRVALLHALAHIELNAVDLTWDMIARSADHRLPRSYFDS